MLNKKALAATAAGEAIYIEDVFSTYLYTGNATSRSITNNIDLSGEGGLVWIKNRTNAITHGLYDTERGATYWLASNTSDEQVAQPTQLTAFNNNGFSLGASSTVNGSSANYASWTFRQAEKFFDVVTYTSDNTAGRQIAHNLGSVPGCIIIKNLTTSSNWMVYHRGVDSTTPQDYLLTLNTTNARQGPADYWESTAPTATHFTVGDVSGINAPAGEQYVAYLFAHDAGGFGDSGSESVIKCGSFTTTPDATINLGWEPQWLLVKRTDSTGNWFMADNMRGVTADSTLVTNWKSLYSNTSGAELNNNGLAITSTGFNAYLSSGTYIYIAIRRGPMKTPESGTEVFSPNVVTPSGVTTVSTGFPVDLIVAAERNHANQTSTVVFDRLRGTRGVAGGGKWLQTNGNSSENSDYGQDIDRMTNFIDTYFYTAVGTTNSTIFWSFKRAPGFFDITTYTGTGSVKTVPHNLGVVPELIILKDRTVGLNGCVYSSALGNTKRLYLFASSGNNAAATDSTIWNNTSPTSSVFTIGTSNDSNWSGATYVAYLFATVPGVSKVGTYTGTAATLQINCGFTSGARFVLIKQTSGAGSWFVWDTARGINTTSDPYLRLDLTNAEITNQDYIDPYSSGFELSSNGSTTVNANGETYIYLAIA